MSERILIVEDDPLILHNLDAALKRAGYVPSSVGNAEEAQRLLPQNTFDLFLLDVSLPGISGIDLARNLYQQKIQAPVIFLTAYEDEALIADAISCAAYSYLVKPVSVRQLLPVIETALANSRQRATQEKKLIAAIESNRTISTAVGMLVAARCCPVDEAFEALRQFARSCGMKIEHLAADIVSGKTRLDSLR